MMKCYYPLNLENNPLDSQDIISPENLAELATWSSQTTHPISILKKSVIDTLQSFNLMPAFCIIFTKNIKRAVQENRLVHADVLGDSNNWNLIHCGINYELNQTENEFMWFDPMGAEIYFPKEPPSTGRFNGIHFGGRMRTGVSEQFKLIESVRLTVPTLVRTNIPHLITYNSPEKPRVALSIRFKETWNSWEEAVEAFAPLIKKD